MSKKVFKEEELPSPMNKAPLLGFHYYFVKSDLEIGNERWTGHTGDFSLLYVGNIFHSSIHAKKMG